MTVTSQFARELNAISTLCSFHAKDLLTVCTSNRVRRSLLLAPISPLPPFIMEVEDALIAQDYLASATSSPVVSEDEDAVNTESARIYFGPITSPEKKLARKHDPSRRTPIRRSKRLSSAPRLLQHMTLQGSEPSDGTPGIISERSGSSTPDAFEGSIS